MQQKDKNNIFTNPKAFNRMINKQLWFGFSGLAFIIYLLTN